MYLVKAISLSFGASVVLLLLYNVYLFGLRPPEVLIELPGRRCQGADGKTSLCTHVERSMEHDSVLDHQKDGIFKNQHKTVSREVKFGKGIQLVPKHYIHNVSHQSRRDLVLPLSQATINGVEKFVFFIGYSRSCHSIIGSMMDAHPSTMLAHEYMLFPKWAEDRQLAAKLQNKTFLFNELYRRSQNAAEYGVRSGSKNVKGYSIDVRGSMWQGMFSVLKVIGDKSGGKTARLYSRNPDKFTEIYHELARTVKIPIRVVHVVRNPYDMIASRVLYNEHDENGQSLHDLHVAGKLGRVSLTGPVNRATIGLFKNVQAVAEMIPALNLTTLEIHNADFVKDPKGTLKKVCKFLDLECPKDYLQACYDKTYKTVSRTRNVLIWDQGSIATVESMMKQYPFLKHYSFRSD